MRELGSMPCNIPYPSCSLLPFPPSPFPHFSVFFIQSVSLLTSHVSLLIMPLRAPPIRGAWQSMLSPAYIRLTSYISPLTVFKLLAVTG